MTKKDDGISQQTEDAIVTKLLQRLSEKGVYSELMNGMSSEDRQNVEDSVERHAARRRAAGDAGW